jgi:hypothetical protein
MMNEKGKHIYKTKRQKRILVVIKTSFHSPNACGCMQTALSKPVV